MPLYLLNPYENGPETCGSPSIDLKQFKTQALEAIKDGIPLRIHTIGDRAVREMLDIFEEGTKLYGKRDIRHVQDDRDGRKKSFIRRNEN